MLGLASALGESNAVAANPLAPLPSPHFAPKAKRIIYLFMNGGPSHVDTFDPKPALAKHAGEAPPNTDAGRKISGGLMPSPFEGRTRS